MQSVGEGSLSGGGAYAPNRCLVRTRSVRSVVVLFAINLHPNQCRSHGVSFCESIIESNDAVFDAWQGVTTGTAIAEL